MRDRPTVAELHEARERGDHGPFVRATHYPVTFGGGYICNKCHEWWPCDAGWAMEELEQARAALAEERAAAMRDYQYEHEYKRVLEEKTQLTAALTAAEERAQQWELNFRIASEGADNARAQAVGVLERMVDPISYFQAEADRLGGQLDGRMAIALRDDAGWYRCEAHAALRPLR